MKRFLLLLLIVSVLLTGCAFFTAKTEPELLIGYAEADITPEGSVPLRGYGRVHKRYSKNTLDPLLVSCMAITDNEGNTILLMAIDLTTSATVTEYRDAISEETCVPASHIAISASHTHSAPDTTAKYLKGVKSYNTMLQKQVLQVAKDAMADRKAATLFGATVETTGLNFVRRYVLKDGTFGGDNYGDFSVGIEGHESEVDNTMQLVKVVREGRPDIILTNFQTHPHRTGGSKKYDVSADIVGAYRTALSEALGCQVMYFTGGSGNVNPTSRIQEENIYPDYLSHGNAMALAAQQADYQPLSIGKVQAVSRDVEAQVNHTYDEYADILKAQHKRWNDGELSTAQFNELANTLVPFKINSPYHANAIYNNSKRSATETFTIYAFSFGDVSFIGAPYEMFDHNGLQIKEDSPFAMTIVGTCCNGGMGYLPSALGFQNGGYSVDTTRYVGGTAEQMVENFTEMLRELYSSR